MSNGERTRDGYADYDDDRGLRRFWPILLLPAMMAGWFLGLALYDRGMLPRLGSLAAVGTNSVGTSSSGGTGDQAAETGRSLWQYRPGDTKGYTMGSAAARLASQSSKTLLHGDTTAAGHQLVSDRINVKPGEKHRLTWRVRAVSGRMAVGLMDATKGAWIDAISITDKDIDYGFVASTTAIQIIIVNNNAGAGEPPVAELGPARLTAK